MYVSLAYAPDFFTRFQSFEGNSMTGHRWYPHLQLPTYSHLPEEHREQFYLDVPIYVIFSYNTPIAWYGAQGWVVPNVKYSATTSRHQGVVRRGLTDYTVI